MTWPASSGATLPADVAERDSSDQELSLSSADLRLQGGCDRLGRTHSICGKRAITSGA